MRSVQTKVSVFVTLLIVVISIISTYLFMSAQTTGIEKELIARGMALSYSLSKAAEEGLVTENLDLIGKATYLIKAEDVEFVQVYSTLWDCVDAYPFEILRQSPHPSAVSHFKNASKPIYIKYSGRYEFYSPIFFSPLEESTYTIGFVRLALSSYSAQKEINRTVFKNIAVSVFFTIFAVLSVNILVRRLVIKPVNDLRKSIAMFKNGTLTGDISPHSDDEIGELFLEFNRMTSTIKENEKNLVESEKRIKSLFERVNHAIFRLDSEGNILEANSRFKDIFGEAKKLCGIFLTGEKTVPDCIQKAVSENVIHSENTAFDKYGNEIVTLLSLYPERDADGVLKGFDGYLIDITEKKKLEETLIQTQKMEAIGTLAGGIAHDFNNMLQGILGYATLIKAGISEDDPLYKQVDVIERSANRASGLTKQLLGFARTGKYITKPINLNNAVRNVVQIISRTFDKAIEIKTSLESGLSPIEADQSQLEHSILNLCLNSRDAMPEGGVLHIETLNYMGKPPFPEADRGKYAVIKVSDTGAGIDKDVQMKMFEPFFTTKEQSKGVGMGLAMVYGVIKNHGGFVTADSELGEGSVFTIYFPATEKPAEAEEIRREQVQRGRGTVLVVDDEDIVRDFAVSSLTQCGYEVLTASDGREALEVFNRRKDDISLVILDIIMPNMGGKETMERLKVIKPDLKILVSSGYSINGTAQEMLDAGATGFIQKPFTVSAIANKVREIEKQ